MNVSDIVASLPGDKMLIVQGAFRECLYECIEAACLEGGKPGGFTDRPDLTIPWPTDVDTVETRLRSIGLGNVIDDFVTTMNSSAEKMCQVVKEVLRMSVSIIPSERMAELILSRDPYACTAYYSDMFYQEHSKRLIPLMKESMATPTKQWDELFAAYNTIPYVRKVYVDIHAYAAKKALDGILILMKEREKNIRSKPLDIAKAQVVKEVFSLDFWRL